MYSWMTGEGFWMLGRAGGGLEKKIGCWVDFGQKMLQVFEVEGLACGELVG